ncbi:MurR/RpiR family transcriptional regulator [Mesorhizobium atlanticum]
MSGRGKAVDEPSTHSLETAARKRSRSLAALGYTKPQTYEELRAVLSSGTVHFPKRLRQVAIFLWQHPSEVALGTIAQVAEQAGVQPSTLVRFAQIFGYSGFSDFQLLFKDRMKGSWPDAQGKPGQGRGAECRPAFPQWHGRRLPEHRSAASATISISSVSRRWSIIWRRRS